MDVMKFYERDEAVFGVEGGSEKFFKISPFKGLKYVHFASFGSFLSLYEAFMQVSARFLVSFMNYMKFYEGGLFSGIFGIWGIFPPDFMKLGKGSTSLFFMFSQFAWAGGPRPYVGKDFV